MADDGATTDDALLGGRVRYRQPARGYRAGVEAPLLAAFAHLEGRRPPRTIADLGAGPGAVGLCLALAEPRATVILVEKNALHAELARRNVEANGLSSRARVIESEVSSVLAELGRGSCDLVVSNPPWFDRHDGPPAEGDRRETARGLDAATLDSFLTAARQLLGRGGRFAMTFPAGELGVLFAHLTRAGLAPKRLRMLHPRAGEAANALFVDARAARPGGLVVEPPLFLRGEGERYTREAEDLLWPGRAT